MEATPAQREEKRGENSLEAMPAQIPADLCIGTCGHLNEQLQKRILLPHLSLQELVQLKKGETVEPISAICYRGEEDISSI